MCEKGVDYNAGRVLESALDIGEAMLRSGAEILRVEDTVRRICQAYGGGSVDVFSILSLIIVSWKDQKGENTTLVRRVYSYATDLCRLEQLNALSRDICENTPECDEVEKRVEAIMSSPNRKISRKRFVGYVLTAAPFAIFFGGNMRDAVAAGIVGALLYLWDFFFSARSKNRVVYIFFSSMFASAVCILSVIAGIAVHADKVMMGVIMLLIPGISLVNSLRDMMIGDIMTGILRLAEALMMSVAIAAGFGVAIMIFRSLWGV